MSAANTTTTRAAACFDFDSQPTELVLIEEHLRPWLATGLAPAAPYVHVVDMYAAGPEELSRRFAPAVARDGERAWYFLTRLRVKVKGRRFTRMVDTGAGWWHGEGGEKDVKDGLAVGQPVVGRRQLFSFMTRVKGGERIRTGWLMTEVRLGSGGGGLEEDVDVLCKVYRSKRHPGEPAAAVRGRERAEVADGGDGSSVAPSPANSDGEVTAAAAPGRNEGSAETSVAAPAREANAADEQSSVATRKRPADGDEQSSDASGKRKKTAETTSSPAPSTELHCCPRCGFDLNAAQAVVPAPPANSEPETRAVLVEGHSAVRAHTLYNFF